MPEVSSAQVANAFAEPLTSALPSRPPLGGTSTLGGGATIIGLLERLAVSADTRSFILQLNEARPGTFAKYAPLLTCRPVLVFAFDHLHSLLKAFFAVPVSSVQEPQLSEVEECILDFERQGADFGWLREQVSSYKKWVLIGKDVDNLAEQEREALSAMTAKRMEYEAAEHHYQALSAKLDALITARERLGASFPYPITEDSRFIM